MSLVELRYEHAAMAALSVDGVSALAVIDGSEASDTLSGTEGKDVLNGLGEDDFLQGFGGADKLNGGDGDDYLKGGEGDDTVNGGAGLDRAGYNGASGPVHVSLLLQGQAQDTGAAGFDTLVGVEYLTGTNFGGDVLIGDKGNNWLWGGQGDDSLDGGLGDDLLTVGSSNSTIIGGKGVDTLSVLGNTVDTAGDVTVNLLLQGEAQDTGQGLMLISGIENVTGSIHDDTLIGDDHGNFLGGVSGDDTLTGNGGNDVLTGDGYIDVDSAPYLLSGPITTFLDDPTSSGDDVLDGGAGNDTLVGGHGVDQLTGGAGNDTFRFFSADDSAPGASDVITDLAKKDVIDLSAIDADVTVDGDQAFELVKKLDGHAGQAALVYDKELGVTHLLLDTDGDGQANADIVLQGQQKAFDHFVL